MLGTSGAAELPGGAEGRGRALLRRPQDDEPLPVRIALTDDDVIRRIAQRWAGAPTSPPPWRPALPTRLPLDALLTARAGSAPSEAGPCLVLGRADEPENQAQPLEVLHPGRDRGLVVLGAPGTGRTTALRVIAAQHRHSAWFPDDPEAAVDLLAAWVAGGTAPPDVVLADDLDLLHARLPLDVGHEFVQRWEQLVRSSATVTWVLAAGRATGPLARVLEALRVGPCCGCRHASSTSPRAARSLTSDAIVRRGGPCAESGRCSSPGSRVPGWSRAPESCGEHAGVGAAGGDHGVGHPGRRRRRRGVGGRASRLRGTGGGSGGERNGATARAGGRCRELAASVGTVAAGAIAGEVLIRAERPGELRQLVGIRAQPPYARPDAGRAWSVIGDRPPRRVVLPALDRR